MTEAELRELGDDIKKRGLQSPIAILVGEDGTERLLDGINRLDAMELVGLPTVTDGELNSDIVPAQNVPGNVDAHAYVLSCNLYRRHLSNEQKRDLIAKLLKLKPNASDRQIAKMARASHPTVADVRGEEERRGKISTSSTRTDAKGREQPAKKQKPLARADADAKPAERAANLPEVTEPVESNLPNVVGGVQAKTVQCSFCGKSADQVRTMVAGAEGNICDACVGQATAAIEAKGFPISQDGLESHLKALIDLCEDDRHWPEPNAGRKARRANAIKKLRAIWLELTELAKPAARCGRPTGRAAT
jgi:hypothetical protein